MDAARKTTAPRGTYLEVAWFYGQQTDRTVEGQNAILNSTRVAPNGISPVTSARNRPKPGNGLSAYLYQPGTIHFRIFSSKDKADVFKLIGIGQQCWM